MTNLKSKFFKQYPGPRGPHLSHLTHTSLTGTYKDEDQKSIHPGARRKQRKAHNEENSSDITL